MGRSKGSNSSRKSSNSGRATRSSSRNGNNSNQPSGELNTGSVQDGSPGPCGDLDKTIVPQVQSRSPNDGASQLPVVSETSGANVSNPQQVDNQENIPEQSGILGSRLHSLQSAFEQSQETMNSIQENMSSQQETMRSQQEAMRSLQLAVTAILQKLEPLASVIESRENIPSQQTGLFRTPKRSTLDLSNSTQAPDGTLNSCRPFGMVSQDEAARQSPFQQQSLAGKQADLNVESQQTLPKETGLPRGILNPTQTIPRQDNGSANRPHFKEYPFNSTLREYAPDNPDYDTGSRQLVMNQVPPPTFDGTKAEARAWLLAYENAQTVNNYLPSQMYARVSPYLKGYAWQWWLADERQYPDSDWYTFRARFLEHFSGEDAKESLRKELREARQKPNESPKDYFVRASGICLQFDKRMPEQELIRLIAKGLRPEAHNFLTPHKPIEEWTYTWLCKQLCKMKIDRERKESRDSKPHQKNTSKSPTRKSSQPRNLTSWLCWNCNVTGHTIDKCPNPRDETTIKANREAFKSNKSSNKDEAAKTSRGVNKVETSPSNDLPCDVAKKPFITLKLNAEDVSGRIDTGADMTVIPERIAKLLNIQLLPWDTTQLRAVNNQPLNVLGKASITVTYETKIRP